MFHQLVRFIQGRRGQVVKGWLKVIDARIQPEHAANVANEQPPCSSPRMIKHLDALLRSAVTPARISVAQDEQGCGLVPADEFVGLLDELNCVRRVSFAVWWLSRGAADAAEPIPAKIAA